MGAAAIEGGGLPLAELDEADDGVEEGSPEGIEGIEGTEGIEGAAEEIGLAPACKGRVMRETALPVAPAAASADVEGPVLGCDTEDKEEGGVAGEAVVPADCA